MKVCLELSEAEIAAISHLVPPKALGAIAHRENIRALVSSVVRDWLTPHLAEAEETKREILAKLKGERS